MFWSDLVKSIIVGIIQGVTEWLPISSTAHMLLFGKYFDFNLNGEFSDLFFTLIQLASVLAVIVIYFHKLLPFSKKIEGAERKKALGLWGRVIVGSIPVGVVGFIFDPLIEKLFYSDDGETNMSGICIIAAALIVYGFLFIVSERNIKNKGTFICVKKRIDTKGAFLIGLFQALAIVPGTSRSGSTILGSRMLGVSREESAEFSFFLAIPAMVGAGGYKLLKAFTENYRITSDEGVILFTGCAVSFLISLFVIGFLTDFLKRHTFIPFGVYRIIIGTLILITLIFR